MTPKEADAQIHGAHTHGAHTHGAPTSEAIAPEVVASEVVDSRDFSPKVLKSESVWMGKVFGMRTDLVQLGEGSKPVVRDYLDHTGAAAIVCLRDQEDEDGNTVPHILLVSQYRHPVKATLWEIPAGLLDKEGEDPLEAAKRELREEADLTAATWRVLVDLFTSPGASDESLRVFLATDLAECKQAFERTEEEALMQRSWVPLQDAVRKVFDGSLHNPSAVVGVLAAWGALEDNLLLREANAPWFR